MICSTSRTQSGCCHAGGVVAVVRKGALVHVFPFFTGKPEAFFLVRDLPEVQEFARVFGRFDGGGLYPGSDAGGVGRERNGVQRGLPYLFHGGHFPVVTPGAGRVADEEQNGGRTRPDKVGEGRFAEAVP